MKLKIVSEKTLIKGEDRGKTVIPKFSFTLLL